MLAEMEVVTRQITVVNVDGTERSIQLQEREDESDPPPPGKAHLKKWWTPILQMQFDDGLCPGTSAAPSGLSLPRSLDDF